MSVIKFTRQTDDHTYINLSTLPLKPFRFEKKEGSKFSLFGREKSHLSNEAKVTGSERANNKINKKKKKTISSKMLDVHFFT